MVSNWTSTPEDSPNQIAVEKKQCPADWCEKKNKTANYCQSPCDSTFALGMMISRGWLVQVLAFSFEPPSEPLFNSNFLQRPEPP
jgi:hypothetical protein